MIGYMGYLVDKGCLKCPRRLCAVLRCATRATRRNVHDTAWGYVGR